MSIIAINVNTTGLIGDQIEPRRCTLITTDSLAVVTAAGYLNNQNLLGNQILPTDIFDILYLFNPQTKVGVFGIFQVTYSSTTGFTLNIWENPGNVLLPVVSGDFAVFNGTTGQIKDAGYSATNAAKTKVVMLNAAPTINHVAIFTAADGTIGDGGVLGTAAAKAASNNALSTLASTAGSGFTIGHLISAADAAGTIQDSGVVASEVQLSANIKAARTANIGGGGAGPISVVVAGVTAASIITGTIQVSSNPVTIESITATATGFDILFSADPGATCTVNYIAFVVTQ
jgi:hypothetical protein